MKKILLTILFSGFVLAQESPPIDNPSPEIEKIENGCFPSAILLKEELNKRGIWSRIIQVLFKQPLDDPNAIRGHAFVEYIYPKNSTNLWLYDNTGSWKVNYNIKDDPDAMSRKIFEEAGTNFILIRAKYFFE